MEKEKFRDSLIQHPFLFATAGEMAKLVRENAWSSTPIGDINSWFQSLKTTVQIMLGFKQSMWMGSGEELAFFYNDSYRPTLGIKHPDTLGKPPGELWSEMWKDVEPLIKSVFETGEATWSENLLLYLERSGFPEETYYTFSYSPILDDCGKISGIFTAVAETTEIVQGDRQLKTLRDLGKSVTLLKTEKNILSRSI